MQWVFILLATSITFAILTYMDDKRRVEQHEPKATLTAKVAIFFSLLLIFFGIFYWFDDGAIKVPSKKAEGGGASVITESQRIQNIKEDCYDGIAPF